MPPEEQVLTAVYESRFQDNSTAAAKQAAAAIAEYNKTLDSTEDSAKRNARSTQTLINLNDAQTQTAKRLVTQTNILQQTQAALAADAATGGARQAELGRAIEGATAKVSALTTKLADLRSGTGATAAEVDNLRAKYDPLYAAMSKAREGLAEVKALNDAGKLSAQGLAAATDQVTASYRGLVAAAEDAAKATVAANQAAYNGFVAKTTRGLNFDVPSTMPGAQASAQREADVNFAFGEGAAKARAAIDPLYAASLRYAEAQDAINDALSKGVVTGERALELQTALTEAYNTANNPLNAEAAALAATAKQTAAAMEALDALQRQYDPLYAAMQQSSAAQAEINGLFDAGLLSAEAQAAALDKATAGYRTLTTAAEESARATAAANAAQGQAAANAFATRIDGLSVASSSPADQARAQREADLNAAFVDEYDKERRAIDPLYAASMKYADALNAIDAARAKGVISNEQSIALRAQETKSFADSSTPIDTHVAALQRVQKESDAAAASSRVMGIQVIQAVSGISTGQPVLTVLIQQGHQIVDTALAMGTSFKDVGAQAYALFQRLGGFPVLIGVGTVAAMAAMIASAERASSRLSALRDTLRLTTDGYTALAASVDSVARKVAATSGLSFSDAFDATKIIASAKYFSGTADELERLAKMAEGVGKIMGDGAAEGAAFLAKAITAPLAAAQELAQRGFPPMTAELLRTVEQLTNAGKGGQALQIVLGTLAPAVAGAAKDISPLRKALDDLGNVLSGTKDGMAGFGAALARDFAQGIESIAIQLKELKDLWAQVKDLASRATPGAIGRGAASLGARQAAETYQESLPAVAKVDPDFRNQLLGAAGKYNLDPDILARLYRVEAVRTGPGQYADSPTGPVGPMQVAPSTFAGLQRLYPDEFGGQNVRDLGTNANASARLFGDLLAKYGNVRTAVLAYHDGEAKVDAMLAGKGQVSDAGLDEMRRVTSGYTGTGRAPSRADAGSFASLDYVAPGAGAATAGSASRAAAPVVGTGARDDARALSDEVKDLANGGRELTREDIEGKLAKIRAAMAEMEKGHQTGSATYKDLAQAQSDLVARENQLLSPQEKFLRGQQDQIAAGAGLYAGDQKLIAVREQLAQIERDQGGTFSPAQRAEAESNALRLMSEEFSKQIATQDLAIASNDNIAAAYGRGYAAVARVTASQQAYTQSLQDFPKGSAAQIAAQAKLTEEIIRTATSQQNLKLQQDTKGNEDQLAYLQKEASLIGVATEKRDAELAVFKARQEAAKTGLPIDEAALALNLRSVDALARQSAANKQLESSYTDLANIGVNAFQQVGDAIVEALAQGRAKTIDFGDVFRGVIASILKQLATLAVVNPILNTLFGGNRSTLSSGLSVLFGSSGTPTIEAAVDSTVGNGTLAATEATFGYAGSKASGSLAGASTGTANSGVGVFGMLSAAKTAYQAVTSLFTTGGSTLAGLAQTATSYVASGITSIAGNALSATNAALAATTGVAPGVATASEVAAASITEAAGASTATTAAAASAASTITAAIPYIGAAITLGTELLQGNWRGAAFVAAGAAIGTVILPGIGTALGAAAGALVDAFFPQHAKNPYLNIDLNASGGRLATGKVASQIIDPTETKNGLDDFAAGLNKYMDDVQIKLANADGRLVQFGVNMTAGKGPNADQGNLVNSVEGIFKYLRFTAARDDGSNLAIAKAGALPGQEFTGYEGLRAALIRIGNFADGLDLLGIQLKSVGNDLTNIQIAGLKGAARNDFETALAHDLPGQSFANVDAFQAEVNKVVEFVGTTIPTLSNPVIAFTSQLQDQIGSLVKQYADAIATAQKYGLATEALTAGQARAIQQLQAPAIQALQLSNLQILERGQAARGQSTQATQISEFDISANQQRTALADSFKNIWGSLIPDAREYAEAAKTLDETLAAERVALVKKTNDDILAAEKQAAAEQLAAARQDQDSRLSLFSQFVSIRDRAADARAGSQTLSGAIDAYNLKAIDETKAYSRSLLDYYGQSFAASADYHNRMSELEATQGAERLAIVKSFNGQITQAAAQAYASARSTVLAAITGLADYGKTLQTSAASPLAPQAQYRLALSQFRAVSGAAAAGDFNSLQKLQGYSDTLLTASRAVNGSGTAYAADYKAVLAALQTAATAPVDKLTDSAMKAAMEDQTKQLSGKLDELKAELVSVRRELQQQSRGKQAA